MHFVHIKATKNQHGDMEITTDVNKAEGNGRMLNCCTHKAKKVENLEIHIL
jgi:hypothetical protein